MQVEGLRGASRPAAAARGTTARRDGESSGCGRGPHQVPHPAPLPSPNPGQRPGGVQDEAVGVRSAGVGWGGRSRNYSHSLECGVTLKRRIKTSRWRAGAPLHPVRAVQRVRAPPCSVPGRRFERDARVRGKSSAVQCIFAALRPRLHKRTNKDYCGSLSDKSAMSAAKSESVVRWTLRWISRSHPAPAGVHLTRVAR